MKIAVFGNAMGLGGSQTAFRRLVEFFSIEGHEVGVIALAGPDDSLRFGADTVFVCRINNFNPRKYVKAGQTLSACIRTRLQQPDLFISVGLANTASLIARFLPRTTFRICQDFIFERDCSDPLLASGIRGFQALALQAPSMVDALLKTGYAKLPVAWLPCFPNVREEGLKRVETLDSSNVRFAYFGRLASNKGIDLLLKAMAAANFICERPMLDIWGSGDELAGLKEMTNSLKLNTNVTFRGRYPDGKEGARLLCSYDGLILPSTGCEGLPLILLEAMAYGVPFLTTNMGAIPDCCRNNEDAVMVEPTLESLSAGMELFTSRSLAKTFSVSRLIAYSERHFAEAVMASRWRKMMADPSAFFCSHGV